MPLFLSIYVISIIAFVVHFYRLPANKRTKTTIIELLLLYQIVFSLGVTSLLSFIGLTFMQEYVAALTNWPSCPFEQQLANVNLAFGVLGILSIWYRENFWISTVLGFSIWILGDGIHHLYHYWFYNNASPGNIGVPLYTDFIVPIVLLALLVPYVRNLPRRKK